MYARAQVVQSPGVHRVFLGVAIIVVGVAIIAVVSGGARSSHTFRRVSLDLFQLLVVINLSLLLSSSSSLLASVSVPLLLLALAWM
jgi:hypothetical protein